MKRKIVTIFLIVFIAVPLLFFLGTGLALILAPGTRIFGIEYVRAGEGNYKTSENVRDFNGDVYIDAFNVPITITFNQYYKTNVYFAQEFTGFTKETDPKPSIDISIDSKDNLRITTTEIRKFIYAESNSSEYYLNIVLPMSSAPKSFYINANSSKLTINGTANFNNFEFVSKGKLKVNNQITVNKLKYHTNKAITIGNNINVKNVNLKTTNKDIKITKDISGDIVAETTSGQIKFVSCNNFTAKTNSGSIKNYGDTKANVRKNVKVETGSGSLTLGNVATSENSAKLEFKSSSGKISVVKMYDGLIDDARGKINIGQARNLEIKNDVGNIEVGEVSQKVSITGKNGKVNLGTSGVVANPTVKTTTGAISVQNATGTVVLESKSSDITFVNKSSENITLKAGKKLTAKELKGKVTATANDNVKMVIATMTGDVKLETGSKCKKVTIDASKVLYTSVDYSLKSTKNKKASLYVGDECIKTGSSIESTSSSSHKKITVTSSYAKIHLYLGK